MVKRKGESVAEGMSIMIAKEIGDLNSDGMGVLMAEGMVE